MHMEGGDQPPGSPSEGAHLVFADRVSVANSTMIQPCWPASSWDPPIPASKVLASRACTTMTGIFFSFFLSFSFFNVGSVDGTQDFYAWVAISLPIKITYPALSISIF